VKEIKVSLDTVGYNSKPKDGEIGKISNRIGKGIEHLCSTNIRSFVENVGNKGQTFCPATFHNGSRKKENFEQMPIFVLDIDGGITKNELFERAEKYNTPILFAYETFSSVNKNRFRVGFLNDVSISDIRAAEILQNALMTIFPEADKSSKDISKMYFGGHNSLLHFDFSIPEINIESVVRNLSLYLRDKHGPTHYKREIAKFAKSNKIKLNKNNLLDVSIVENITKIDGTNIVGKISPISIIVPNIANGEKLPNLNYLINLDEGCTNTFCANEKVLKNHNPFRASVLNDISSKCELFKDFVNGRRWLDHDELFGLATNLVQVESGAKKFFEILVARGYFEYSEEKYSQWNYHLNYFKNNGYKPKSCSLFCFHKDLCVHTSNILSTVKPKYHAMERIANFEENFVSIDEVQKDLEQRMEMAVKADSYTIDIIKAQTAIGKSTTFIKLMKKYPNIKFLIAASSNDLKRELLDRAIYEGVEIKSSPSLHELDLPDDVMEKIDNYYNTGRHRLVKPYIKKLIKHNDPRCSEKLANYLSELEEFNNSRCNAVTTHKKIMYMGEEQREKYDVVIIDEDIILKSFIPEQSTIPVYEFNKVLRKIPPNSQLAKKIKVALNAAESESKFPLFELPSIEWDDDEEGMSKTVDMPSFCEAKRFGYLKNTGENNLSEVGRSNDEIVFFKPVNFKSDVKTIIVSATVDETVCKYFFGEDKVNFYECKKARYSGSLNQYHNKSMSRACIKKGPAVFDKIEKLTNVKETITFKKFLGSVKCTHELYFGKTEGRNCYEGQDINVVGTPHQPEWIYKLFAYTLGPDFDVDSELKHNLPVVHNGYKFRFSTYEDEVLRNIQFWMIESDLEQAVGRARLLRHPCRVNLFSNFPLSQAVMMEAEY